MTCQERITALQNALDAIDARLAQLEALPNSDTDPGIIAAIQLLRAQHTAVEQQLIMEKASCSDSLTPAALKATALPAPKAAAAKEAAAAIKEGHVAHKKSTIQGSKELVAHSKALVRAMKKRK